MTKLNYQRTMTMNHCRVTGNTTSAILEGGEAAGVLNDGTLRAQFLIVADNVASDDGGADALPGSGAVVIPTGVDGIGDLHRSIGIQADRIDDCIDANSRNHDAAWCRRFDRRAY